MVSEQKKQIINEHGITLSNRSKMTITGVLDVMCFNDDKIELKTNMGKLIIKGRSLNINKLNTDSGELNVTGEIQILEYVNKKNKEGMFAGLFR